MQTTDFSESFSPEAIQEFGEKYRDFHQFNNREDAVYGMKKIQTVPEMHPDFFAKPFRVQVDLIKWLASGANPWDVCAYLKLLRLTDSSHYDIFSPYWQTYKVGEVFGNDSYSGIYRNFKNFQSTVFDGTGNTHSLDSTMLVLLAMHYGRKRVTDAMEYWTTNTSSDSFYDFVLIVEGWSDFKDYPADWCISILGNTGSKARGAESNG